MTYPGQKTLQGTLKAFLNHNQDPPREPPTSEETCEAIKYGTFAYWPKEIQGPALMQCSTYYEEGEKSPLQWAAKNGLLPQIPKEFLTEEYLLAGAERENSDRPLGFPLLVCIKSGHLDQIPKEVLTKKALLTPKNGHTVLHTLAAEGLLAKIPKGILTEEMLLTSDQHGNTPLHRALWCDCPEKIPIKLSIPTLKALLKWKHCSQASRTWIEKEIRKPNLQKSLQDCNHPEL